MSRYSLILFCVTILIVSSCKPTHHDTGSPCGDPPPVAEAPGMRVIDKATGNDYLIAYPDMLNKLDVKRSCTDQTVMVYFEPLKNSNNAVYGYAINFSYLPLFNAPDSCRIVTWTWDGNDKDTMMYYAHMGTCQAVLDSIYYNGVKVQEVADSMANPVKSYYTIYK